MSEQPGPELADVRRYGRRLMTRFVDQAREADRPQFGTMLTEHLGLPADRLPVAEQQWPAYEHVNVQAALDAWLGEPGREHRLVGVAGYRHRGSMGLADLLGQLPEEAKYGPRPGNVLRTSLPTGPEGQTKECLRVAVLLVSDADGRSALLFRGPDPEDGREQTTVEVIASREGAGAEIAARLADLAVEHNVYRGQVVSFGRTMFGRQGSFLRFHRREALSQDELILPAATFDDVRRQVVGVARHREALRSAGQHLKRGLLLYGPPGVGQDAHRQVPRGRAVRHHDRAAQRRHPPRDQGGVLDRADPPARDDRGRGRGPDRRGARPLQRQRDAAAVHPPQRDGRARRGRRRGVPADDQPGRPAGGRPGVPARAGRPGGAHRPAGPRGAAAAGRALPAWALARRLAPRRRCSTGPTG